MKENANPTIYDVKQQDQKTSDYFGDLVASSVLNRYSFDPHGINTLDVSSIPTSIERSVYMALTDIEKDTQKSVNKEETYDPVGLLKGAGMYPDTESTKTSYVQSKPLSGNIMKQCYFIPAKDDQISKSESQSIESFVTNKRDPIKSEEIFDIIRNIQDPEHPLTLQQLNVVNLNHVAVKDVYNGDGDFSTIDVRFTPTIPHCSMATLIGLCIRVKLLRSIPRRFKVTVRINPGTHASEMAINRQLNDKERVIAALENVHLLSVVNKCISNGMKGVM
mmetsp:Transcript_8101/g.9353  ORF Transcript_8101/g.9353 Transcript_8101/m.9353 type:complete len:277 (-) Transcript_8101:32-862(-)